MPNQLSGASSPYLLQHAGNPVDWMEWGPDVLARARAENKPILLSVGYAACHWCHVMAHESFENPAIAALMNRDFVNVKVDREERPDIDALYMEAVQTMTGHGGWPMTVFLTPDGEPFYGGTYFPPVPRHGMSSFPQLLAAVAQAWQARRDDVLESARSLTDALRQSAAAAGPREVLTLDLVLRAAQTVLARFDPINGGFGRAPKFPQASLLGFLLGRYERSLDPSLLEALTLTLTAMAGGGIYDHLAGGFHRYSVDDRWALPHFEKMLYDNAQLARIYVDAWLVTGTPRYRQVVEETLDYLLREMTDPQGGLYATQDADTSAGEGAYFTWTPEDLSIALPDHEAAAAAAYWDVTPGGNFEGATTVLSARRSSETVADELGVTPDVLMERLGSARAKLLALREAREQPMTDTKVLVSWNGLAIDALARAGAVLDRPDYVAAAIRAANFIQAEVQLPDGLAHSWRNGQARIPAFQDDYAALANGLISLYEASFDPEWLTCARGLLGDMQAQFSANDAQGGGFFRTGPRHETLIARQKDQTDGATPSGNSLAAAALLRLAALTGDADFEAAANDVFRVARPYLARAPDAFGALLAVLDDYLSGVREIAVVGPWASGGAELVGVLRGRFLPGTVVAYASEVNGPASDVVALLKDRHPVDGRAAAYVCYGRVCERPVTSQDDLTAQLANRMADGSSAQDHPATQVAGSPF